ncbi:MAG: hypothetical protein JJE52_06935 [Acidimicrobiia bacterium]|nr:hypothetical protein [Acidimicrobiia bacterium]
MNAKLDPPAASSSTTILTRRVVDNLFGRLGRYLFPVVLFAAIGILTASGVTPRYQAGARLSASANPLVGGAQARGAAIADWETAASGTARLINEQIQTDVFTLEVAERTGLAASVEAGAVTLETIRGQIRATGQGSSSVGLVGRWDDPATAHRLVESTLEVYLERNAELIASDSNDAIQFWTERLNEAELRVGQAEDELEAYLRTLLPVPSGQERGADEQLTIARLQGALDRAIQSSVEAQRSIDGARLNLVQAQSEAGRQLRVIDPATVPTSPESIRSRIVLTVLMFTALGVVVSLTALVASTLLDRTMRIDRQVAAIAGTTTATIPLVRSASRWWRGPDRRPTPPHHDADEPMPTSVAVLESAPEPAGPEPAARRATSARGSAKR